MPSLKKTLLTASLTALLTCGAASLAFYSTNGFAQEGDSQAAAGDANAASQGDGSKETIGQSIGRSIDDAIASFEAFSKDVGNNWDALSDDLKKSLDDAAQSLSDASDELNARIRAAQDEGYTPEDPNEASRSSDPYGYIEFVQNTTLPATVSEQSLGQLLNAYGHCEPRSKRWEYFKTLEEEHLISMSCTLTNAPAQVAALGERTDVKFGSTLNSISSGLSSLFGGEEEPDAALSDQAKEQAHTQSLQLKDVSFVAMFAVSKQKQELQLEPRDLYLNVHYSDDKRAEIPLEWSHLNFLSSNAELIPVLTASKDPALKFMDALYKAYLQLEVPIL